MAAAWGQRWPPSGRGQPSVVQSSRLDSCLKCFLEDVVFEIGFVFLKKNQCKCVFEVRLGFFFKITVIKKNFFVTSTKSSVLSFPFF